MRSYTIPLVNESGRRIGYGDRWLTHRTRKGPDGPILGMKHVGISIACIDDRGRIILQLRRHRIFDKVRRNVYELESVDLEQVMEDSRADTKKEPVDRRYAPWVHALFALPPEKVKAAFQRIH